MLTLTITLTHTLALTLAPTLVTVTPVTLGVQVPVGCPPGHASSNATSCGYEYPNNTCPPFAPAATCKTNTDCLEYDPKPTCRGKVVTCQSGTCKSGVPGGDLCVATERVGGASIGLNIETSVAGFALVEVQREDGSTVPGMALADAAPIRGSAL
jgi:hypothetical protein